MRIIIFLFTFVLMSEKEDKRGRPPLPEKNIPTLLRLPESLLNDGRLLTKLKYMSLSKYIKQLIDTDLDKE